MSSNFSINIPEKYWESISFAPKNAIIFIRDEYGNIDIAKWSRNGWSSEFGNCRNDPVDFAYISIGQLEGK